MVIGANVKRIREAQRYTQTEIARRCGVTPASISGLEHGEFNPSSPLLVKLARALEVPIEDLVQEPSPLVKAPTPSKSGPDAMETGDERVDKPPPGLWSRLTVELEPGEAGEEEEGFTPTFEYDFEAAAKRVLVFDELDNVVNEARAVGLNDEQITEGLLRHVAEWVPSR